jgi:hypothetical protein
MIALPALIFWLMNFSFMLMVYQEPMILQWAKVVTVIPLTINSQDNYDDDYRPGPQDEEEGYGIVTEVDIVGMPVPLTQKRRFRALAGLVARQKVPLNLPEIKELSNDEK